MLCGTGTAWNGLNQVGVSGQDTVVVFGQGPVGLSGTLSAKAMGAKVIAVDVVPERLNLARRLGADQVLNSRETDPVSAIRDLTGGAGASASLETSGNPAARQQVLECLAPFGRCCDVGVGEPAEIDFNRDVIFKVGNPACRLLPAPLRMKMDQHRWAKSSFVIGAMSPLSNLTLATCRHHRLSPRRGGSTRSNVLIPGVARPPAA